jgi:hypothetical protein
METTVLPAPAIDASSFSIESLLQKAGVYSQHKISSKIESLVRVKGTVTKINRYSYATYITLKEREFILTVKCDSKQHVHEGSQIVVEGALFVKPSTYISGLECYVDGNIVGSWELTNKPVTTNSSLLKKSRFVSLDDLLSEEDLSSVLLLGTDIGVNDVLSQLHASNAKNINRHIIRVNRSDSLIEDIKGAELTNYRAFVIVRGGDDNTMEIWNDPTIVSFLLAYSIPFYTALGHSHSRTLADQYADGYYPTPTAFGSAVNSILSKKKQLKEIESEYARLKQQYVLVTNSPKTESNKTAKVDWVKIIALVATYTAAMYFVFKAIS